MNKRSSAAEALGEIGDLAPVSKLSRVLWHYDSYTRRKARKVISDIIKKQVYKVLAVVGSVENLLINKI